MSRKYIYYYVNNNNTYTPSVTYVCMMIYDNVMYCAIVSVNRNGNANDPTGSLINIWNSKQILNRPRPTSFGVVPYSWYRWYQEMQQHIDYLTKRIYFRILDSSIFPSTAAKYFQKRFSFFFFHNVFPEKVDGNLFFNVLQYYVLLFLKRPI